MSIYNFSIKSSEGVEISLSDYKNKVLLLVNTATKCGLAPQFSDLEVLHTKYKDRGLVVIGFPCDQFMGQEPETNETVAHTCLINFGVTFLLSEKINVNGGDTHPLFVYLKKELPGGMLGNSLKWNFTKFLIAKDGKPFKRYAPTTGPLALEDDIVTLLG
jgi:glutathione peroxidase